MSSLEMRATLRRYLAERLPVGEAQLPIETADGFSPDLWLELASTLGLPGLAVPERFGGAGLSFVDLGAVFEELGASLVCVPAFSSIALAANALVCSDDESAMAELLPGIASGEQTATLAFTEDSGRWELSAVELAAVQDGNRWLLSGVKNYVVDGCTASLILVVARTAAGLCLFAVDGDAEGLLRNPLKPMDATRPQSRLTFQEVPGRLIGAEGAAAPNVERALQLATIALAAEQAGGARRCLEMAVEYAKTRVQFSRPIGSFQAIKHLCADVFVQVQSAELAARHACAVAATGGDDLTFAASLAKSVCSDAYLTAAAVNIQVHGGIGFTWDHAAHLYYRRAVTTNVMLGDPSYHREALISHLDDARRGTHLGN